MTQLSLDGCITLGCALRYALGRHTYVVGSVASTLKNALPHLDTGTLQSMGRDLGEYLGKPMCEALDPGQLPGDINMDDRVWFGLHINLLDELSTRLQDLPDGT